MKKKEKKEKKEKKGNATYNFFSYSQSHAWINIEWPSVGWSNVLLEIPHSENEEYYTTYPKTIIVI